MSELIVKKHHTGTKNQKLACLMADLYRKEGVELKVVLDDSGREYIIITEETVAVEEMPKETVEEMLARLKAAAPKFNTFNGYEIIVLMQLCKHISVSHSTLYGWRSNHEGPISHKYDNTVFYYLTDLDPFFEAHYTKLHEPAELDRWVSPGTMPLVSDHIAARILDLTTSILRGWRERGQGLNYLRLGQSITVYRLEDVIHFKNVMKVGLGPKVRRSPTRLQPEQLPIDMKADTKAPVCFAPAIDSDVVLRDARNLASVIADETMDASWADATCLAAHFVDLDRWLSNGGSLPERWAKNR